VGPRAGMDDCGKSRPLTDIRSPECPVRNESHIKYAIPERTEHIANGCFTDLTT